MEVSPTFSEQKLQCMLYKFVQVPHELEQEAMQETTCLI